MAQPFRRLLIPVDLSPSSLQVVRCAAQLPLAGDATVTLLHVVPRDLTQTEQRVAIHDATEALAEFSSAITAKVRGADVRTLSVVGSPPAVIARHVQTSKAELVVMGRGGQSRGRSFLGSTAERVVRRAQVPVLVVRRGAGRYKRPALAIDTFPEARAAIKVLLRALHDPRPGVRVIRAVESPYREMYYRSITSAQAAAHERKYAEEEALRVDDMVTAALDREGVSQDEADRWEYFLPGGSPRIAVREAVDEVDADLLVLGTHARSGLAYAYLGSVAGDLLRTVECDVLVVPRRSGMST